MDRQSHLERCASKLHHLQLHPALSEYLDLGPDIYEKLVSWIFTFEPFAYWQRSEKNWELRCSGSPGSGKTTFVALAARQLRSKYPSKGSAVASIFIVRDVRWSEATFIEDLLGSIFRQLKAGHTCEGECEVNTALLEYVEACKGHQRGATRIRLIRRALDLCVASLDHAFLVLDGIDRCSPAVELFLEDEFPRLRASGLRILTTSRIPCLRMPARNYNCDTHDCPEPDERLVYWLCQEPECKKLKIVVCVACKEKNVSCKNW
ncbi:hypothetical protein B0T10DRAFT_490924 [Thelonectria olida]|uniref:Nephrocystin 3-like N-terminal domain-containing protein n=1 Tax=Thelonectria olida TaxID=1576542 RepID=A0A9P9AN58_9HYPO|nr:hypothetical protein B0T10DRAFT_490924 [Thelonectria olida]